MAPVPDKAPELVRSFVRRGYRTAAKLTASCDTLIAIGYSFSPRDEVSYGPILGAFARASNRKLIIVSPDAQAIAGRLRREYPPLTIDCEPIKFRKWVAFRG